MAKRKRASTPKPADVVEETPKDEVQDTSETPEVTSTEETTQADSPEATPMDVSPMNHTESGDDLSMITEVSFIDTVDEQYQADGWLIHGAHNPVDKLVMASNGEIQIGGAGRYFQELEQPAPEDTTYHLEVTQDSDWNFPLLVGLVDRTNGSRITDLYDVNFSVSAPNGSLSFDLVWDEDSESFHIKDDEHELNITDGVTIRRGRALQEVQRVRFYKDYVGDLELTESGTPVGEFEFTYTATRKDDRTPDGEDTPPPVVANFKVLVVGPQEEEPEEPEDRQPLSVSRFELYCRRMQLNVKQTPTSIDENQRLLASVINQTFRLPLSEFNTAWRAIVNIVKRERTKAFSEYAIFRGFDRFSDTHTRERTMRLTSLLMASADVADIRDAKDAVSFDHLINKRYISEAELEYLNSIYDA